MSRNCNKAIEALYAKYSRFLHDTDGAAEYLDAIEQLTQVYQRLGNDSEVLLLLVELLLQEYADFTSEISTFIDEKDFLRLKKAASHFHASISNAATASKVMCAIRLEEACLEGDFRHVYHSWLSLHTRLIPMMSVFRQFYNQVQPRLAQC
jgi:hypothetical protein